MTRSAIFVIACAFAGCGGNAAPGPMDVYVAPSDTVLKGCVLGDLSGDMNGNCYARWLCETGGVRTLACGGLDAGVGCVCLQEGAAPVSIATAPASCSDAMTVAAFATAQCGWEGL